MNRLQDEKGMLIVEATMVFPIVFLVVFLMIFLGNAYFQKSRIEAIVTNASYYGAAECASPILTYIEENGTIPDFDHLDTQPYRYFVGRMGTIEDNVKNDVEDRMRNMTNGLFDKMKPSNIQVECKYNNAFTSSTFSVDVYSKIELPIRMIGMDENFKMKLSTRAEVPICDTGEFIRDVNMVADYMERIPQMAELESKLSNVMEKVKEIIN